MIYNDEEKVKNIINLLDFAEKNAKNIREQIYVVGLDRNIEKQKDEQQTKKLEEINKTTISTIKKNGISF